ncbi:MAG: transporter substrate-binding domain-containing protein [Synergistaceae bacterium]|nr:transporter substrate-binding domain-containing protein [Synergistaceae bacterium]
MKKIICSLILVMVFSAGACADVIGTLQRSNANIPDSEKADDVMYVKSYKDELLACVFDKDFKHEGTSIKFYDSLMMMQLALSKGEIDAFSAPEFIGEYMLRTNPEYTLRGFFVGKNPIAIAFGFLEENASLRDRFNSALGDMGDDGTSGILARDFITGPKASNPEPVVFEKFDGAETITVAVTGDMPPLDYVGADGTPAGFNTAILAEIGRRLHININLVNVETGARAVALQSGRADVVFWFQIFAGYDSFKQQPDIPEGVIVSTPYYGWNKAMLIGAKK